MRKIFYNANIITLHDNPSPFSEDFFNMEPDRIRDVKVMRTYLRGRCEYEVI